ncbi:MAG: cytochrome c biogenesis heme-transporting ATPase CcmA [Chromatocurvus sp.]
MTGAGEGPGLLLQSTALTLVRGERELFSGLDFALHAGEVLQIEGENGAGKTSLLRLLAGVARYGYDGKVERFAPLLYIGHLSAVKELLTPRENLAWHVDGLGQHSDAAVCEALAQVGLAGYEDVPSHQLSAGQHRRVNLARLHLSTQPLWLLDEPFTAIDRDGVASLERLFVSHAQRGGAVVLTSHQALGMDYPVTRLVLRAGGEA